MVDFKSRGNLSLEVDNLLINHKNEEQWTHTLPWRGANSDNINKYAN